MTIAVYQHKGYDGKIKQFVYGSGYYPYIYKQRSLVFTEWVDKLQKRLIKAKYNIEQINNIVIHCIDTMKTQAIGTVPTFQLDFSIRLSNLSIYSTSQQK